jgi:plasmid stabilization system protein ParE
MSGYVLGRDAEQDLDDLLGYIAADSVDAADRLTARLFEAFEALARNPGMGHKRS